MKQFADEQTVNKQNLIEYLCLYFQFQAFG